MKGWPEVKGIEDHVGDVASVDSSVRVLSPEKRNRQYWCEMWGLQRFSKLGKNVALACVCGRVR